MIDNIPRLSASQRREQIEHSKFIEIRQLAHHVYVDPDTGKTLMTYQDTLEDREAVKKKVLAFEIKMGEQLPVQFPKQQFIVLSDGTEAMQAVSVMNPNPPPGVPMTMPFQPAAFPAPAPTAPSPSGPPTALAAPPPVASPLQAVQAASPGQMGEPQPQPAPAAPPVTGRKRRTNGAAVAPPPPSVVAAPPSPIASAPTPPPSSSGPAAFIPQLSVQAPAAQTTHAHAVAQPQTQSVSVQILQDDLNGLKKILAAELSDVKGALATILTRNSDLARQNTMLLAILHHLYLSNTTTAQNTQGKANSLPEFEQYMQQFLPR